MCSHTRAGFTLNIIDTPGFVEDGYVNEQSLEILKRCVCDHGFFLELYLEVKLTVHQAIY